MHDDYSVRVLDHPAPILGERVSVAERQVCSAVPGAPPGFVASVLRCTFLVFPVRFRRIRPAMEVVAAETPAPPAVAATPPPKRQASPTPSPGSNDKSIHYSEKCLMALRGGTFDARGFLQKPKRQCPEAEENWRKKLKLLDILNSNPNEVDAALTWVTDRVCGFARKAREGERTTPCWPSTYMTVGKLPKYWRAEYLVAELSSRGFSTERCRSIDQADPEDITRIFDFLHGVHGSTRLPRCCLDKFVCSSVFRERLNDLGRAAAFMAALVRVGRVDWTQMGAYKLVKNSATQIVIKHCDGDEACGRRGTGDAEHSLEIALWVVNLVAMPQGSCRVCVCGWGWCLSLFVRRQAPWPSYFQIVGMEVNLESNFAEHLAKVVLPSDEIPLAKKIGGKTGPNADRLVNKDGRFLSNFAAPIAERIESARASASGVPVAQVAEVIDMNADARRKEAVRLATAKRAPSRKLRKCVGAVAL